MEMAGVLEPSGRVMEGSTTTLAMCRNSWSLLALALREATMRRATLIGIIVWMSSATSSLLPVLIRVTGSISISRAASLIRTSNSPVMAEALYPTDSRSTRGCSFGIAEQDWPLPAAQSRLSQ